MAIINSKKIGLSSVSTFQADWYNVSATYGPWVDLKEMVETLSGEDYSDKEYLDYYLINNIPVGLTVGLIEDGKVVEYWKSSEGQGFTKKRKSSDVVDNYSTAKILATFDNIGSIIKVNNSETIDGITYTPGLYIVNGEGSLCTIGNSIGSVEIVMSNLDSYNEEDSDEELPSHTFVSRVANKNGSIYPVKSDLDTDNVLMLGSDETNDDTFVTVTGVNVGGLSNGDVISNGTSLNDLLKKILQKEIDVVIGENPSVTLSLNSIPNDSICEVGTRIHGTLSKTFSKGYFVGETDEYDTHQESFCKVKKTTYTPSESYDFNINEGYNKFTVNVTYTASNEEGDCPQTNMGNDSDVFIPAGSCSDEKSVIGAYKCFYGNLNISDLYYGDSEDDFDTLVEYIKYKCNMKWIYEDTTSIGTCSNGSDTVFCCLCPEEYKLYGEQIGCSINPIVAIDSNNNVEIYEHVLPNGVKHNYVLYIWNAVNQTYFNVNIVKK